MLLIVKPVTLPHNSNDAAPRPLNRMLRNAILVSSLVLSGVSCGKTHDPCASPSVYSEASSKEERTKQVRQWMQTCKPHKKMREKFGMRGVDILGGITQEWIHGRPTRELIRDLVREQPDSLEVITFLEQNQFIPQVGWVEGFARKMAQQTGEERRRHKKQTLEEIVDDLRCSRCCGRYATKDDCAYLERTDASGRKARDVDKAWGEIKDEVLAKFGKQGGLVYQLWFYGIFPSYPPPADMEAKRKLQKLIDAKPKETLGILAFLEENGVILNEKWGQKYQAYVDETAQEAMYRNIGITVAYVLGSILVLGSGAYLGLRIRKKRKAAAAFMKAKEALAQADPPLPAMAGERPAGEPKKVVEAASTAQSGGEDMEKKLEEEFARDVERYGDRINEMVDKLMNETTTPEQLLRLEVEWENMVYEMSSKSKKYYKCDKYRGSYEYSKRILAHALYVEILTIEGALKEAYKIVTGKTWEQVLFFEKDEAFDALRDKMFEEYGSETVKKQHEKSRRKYEHQKQEPAGPS